MHNNYFCHFKTNTIVNLEFHFMLLSSSILFLNVLKLDFKLKSCIIRSIF